MLRPTAAAIAVAACFNGLALANPTNPTVVHGTASFQQAGGVLNVTNSHNAIINWGSFSIGVNELTRFIQPSALSAVLNRVTGQDPSAILGALQSNGRVFLLNPNGIMFGAGAQINVAGLVASTLNLSNEDFLSGRMRFTDGTGAGSVINQGAINASGGPVYLVGNAVTNQGIITSPQGEIVLAAGKSVELVNPGTPNLRVEIQSDNNEARNLGSIVADAGRIGIYAGLVKQGGVINADSMVAEGGRIMLKSTKRTDIEAGSVTSARGTNGGEILALSGMTDGVVQVSGNLNASSNAATAPGNGGFIETSAATVNAADTASVGAEARNGGSRGRWLIDPTDFVIAVTGGNTSGAAISSALNGGGSGTEIDIQSTSGGSIQFNDSIAWSSAADLRLFAYGGDINVNQSIANNDAGSVKMYAGWDGASTTAPAVAGTGAINLNAAVSVGGGVHLVAGGNITQNSGGDMMAAQLLAKSVNGNVVLTQNANSIGTVAGGAGGQFKLKNAGALTVGSVGGSNGIDASLISLIASGGSLGQTAAGVLTTPELIAISTNSSVNLTSASNAVGTVSGRSAGQFALKNAGGLVVGTVDGIDGIIVNGSNPGLHAAVNLDVTGSLTVNQYVKAIGASSGISSAGGNGTTTLSSTGAMTLNAEVLAQGGDGAEGAAGGNAVLALTSGGGMTVNGAVTALGGHGGETYTSNPAGQGGSSTLTLTNSNSAASVLVGVLGNVQSTGGGGGDSYSFAFDGPAGLGGDGVVSISSDGGFVHQGYVGASGGHGGERTGGAARRGGDASIQVSALGAGGLQVANGSTISASGGQGGPAIFAVGGGAALSGGGGDALVQLASSGGMTVEGNVYATGGSVPTYPGDDGGIAGNATIRMTSGSTLTTTSTANIRADGGEGWGSSSRGGHALVDLKSSGNLLISGGDVNANGGDGTNNASGGNATIKTVSTGGSATFVAPYVVATGGGADSFSSGNGGDGVVQVEALGEISLNSADLTAYGGQSGSAGAAGGALVLMSTSGNMSIANSSYVQAWGGSGGYMSSGLQAGGAGVTLLAGGTALIDGSEGSAFGGGSADTGGAAAVNMVAGSVAINNGTLYAQRGSGNVTNGSSGILVASAGGISMDGAWVYNSGGFTGLVGSSVVLDNNTDVTGGTGVGATVTGSLTLNNGSTLGGSGGNATITTSGDVLVNGYSRILGNPDVMLRVGGSVRMNNGGTIEAGSVETINLTFLVNNGNSFFVNDLKDVVYDAATGTGFMANGQAAQLGDSLKVTYLASDVVTTLKIPSETLIVAMSSSTKPPDEQKKSADPVNDKNDDGKDGKEKKKSLPICGK